MICDYTLKIMSFSFIKFLLYTLTFYTHGHTNSFHLFKLNTSGVSLVDSSYLRVWSNLLSLF